MTDYEEIVRILAALAAAEQERPSARRPLHASPAHEVMPADSHSSGGPH